MSMCDGLDFAIPTGELTINGVVMHTPAWTIVDLTPLWMGATVRGFDRIVPFTPGVTPYRRRMTVTQHALPMVIIGSVDRLGVKYSDEWEGLEANIDYLRAFVVDPTNAGDGTLPATLELPSGTTRTADIHVLRLALGRVQSGKMLATLDISIPEGVFA
jgi:hypothetical protein